MARPFDLGTVAFLGVSSMAMQDRGDGFQPGGQVHRQNPFRRHHRRSVSDIYLTVFDFQRAGLTIFFRKVQLMRNHRQIVEIWKNQKINNCKSRK